MHPIRFVGPLSNQQDNQEKNGQQVNNNNREPHTREPRHPGTDFVDSHQFQGRVLRLLMMEMDSLHTCSVRVYKEDKTRLQDGQHMNRLPL